MKVYIGTKILKASPMSRADYNSFRNWELPKDENGEDEGYLLEHADDSKPNVEGFVGYISWSPKAQFENVYRQVDGLTFGLAIEAMKQGSKVARRGWNGEGMFCVLVKGGEDVLLKQGSVYAKALEGISKSVEILPYIAMYTTNADGRKAMLPGWFASQTDMLANDWIIIN